MNSSLPKVLVGLKGKPLIQHLLDAISQVSDLMKPVIVVGHKYELVQSYLGPNYIYAFQEGQFGTGHAVAAAKPKVEGKNVLVLYGDMPFIQSASIQKLVNLHKESKSVFSMLTTVAPHFDHEFAPLAGYGRIIRKNGKIVKNQEFVDASAAERQIREVNPGVYLFGSEWLWENLSLVSKNKHGEYYLTDLVEIAINKNVAINTATVDPLETYGINMQNQLRQAEEIKISH